MAEICCCCISGNFLPISTTFCKRLAIVSRGKILKNMIFQEGENFQNGGLHFTFLIYGKYRFHLPKLLF
jgi:hypothetical protein